MKDDIGGRCIFLACERKMKDCGVSTGKKIKKEEQHYEEIVRRDSEGVRDINGHGLAVSRSISNASASANANMRRVRNVECDTSEDDEISYTW